MFHCEQWQDAHFEQTIPENQNRHEPSPTRQVMYSLGEGFVQTPVPDAEEKITAGQ